MNALKKIQKLEQQIAELKAQLEPEFEVGDWIYSEGDYWKFIFRIARIKGNELHSDWAYNITNETIAIGRGHIKLEDSWTRKATNKEVETALRKEWARRCKDAGWDDPDEAEIEGHADNCAYHINTDTYKKEYYSNTDKLYTKNGCVYHDGKFATPKKRNKFFEWEVEYKSDGRVKIGCKTFSKEELRIISDSLSHVKVNAVSSVLDELKKLDL